MRKAALVTGGSRGIGYGIALALAKAGYDLAINGVRDEAEVGVKLQELKSFGIDTIYCQGNIGDSGDRINIITKAVTHFKHINLLVNNAGVAPQKRNDVLDLDEASFDRLMNINLKGTFFLTQQAAKHMQSEKQKDSTFQGCIISITSMSAEVASINRAEYCMSKAALGMMTKLFAVRLAEIDLPVYEIRPGIFKTDMTSVVQEKYDKLLQSGLTLEKRWGMPEDIGKIVVALANGEIPYSTGQVITADGGLTISRL
jgi:3-oxoacyl-[acyl-carrier protein] reductase